MILSHLTCCFVSICSRRQDCGSVQLAGKVLTSLYCSIEIETKLFYFIIQIWYTFAILFFDAYKWQRKYLNTFYSKINNPKGETDQKKRKTNIKFKAIKVKRKWIMSIKQLHNYVAIKAKSKILCQASNVSI